MDILLHSTLSSNLSNTVAKRKSRIGANQSRRNTRYLFGAEITIETLTRTARLKHVLRRGHLPHPLRPLGNQTCLCSLRSCHRPKRNVHRLLEQSSEWSSEPSVKVRRMSTSRGRAGQDPHGLGFIGKLESQHDCVPQREAERESLKKAKVTSEVEDPSQYELTLTGRSACIGIILHGWRAQWDFIVFVSKAFDSFWLLRTSDPYRSFQIDRQREHSSTSKMTTKAITGRGNRAGDGTGTKATISKDRTTRY